MIRYSLLVCATFLIGCAAPGPGSTGSQPRVPESSPETLKIGTKYYIEDNFSMVYLGKGKFSAPEKDYSRLWK